MASKRQKYKCKESRKDKNSLCLMKYYTRLISVLQCYLSPFYLGHFFPLVQISDTLMTGQQHALEVCLDSMEVILSSLSLPLC